MRQQATGRRIGGCALSVLDKTMRQGLFEGRLVVLQERTQEPLIRRQGAEGIQAQRAMERLVDLRHAQRHRWLVDAWSRSNSPMTRFRSQTRPLITHRANASSQSLAVDACSTTAAKSVSLLLMLSPTRGKRIFWSPLGEQLSSRNPREHSAEVRRTTRDCWTWSRADSSRCARHLS